MASGKSSSHATTDRLRCRRLARTRDVYREMQLPTSQLAARVAVREHVRRRTIVILAAIVPWAVAIARSWPTSDPPRKAAPRAAAAVDPWLMCPPAFEVLRERKHWLLSVNRYEQLYVVTAPEPVDRTPPRMPAVDPERGFELEPVHRRAILDRLLAACVDGRVTIGQSNAMQLEEPTILFSPGTSSRVTILIGPSVLYVDGYGATAR